MIVEYVLVFVLTMFAGGWSIPAGVLFGLDPIGVFVAALLGSLTVTSIVLFAGGPWRDRLFVHHFPDADERVSASRVGDVLERWGIPGLAVGSILFGPALTLAAVLVLGIDRSRFFGWYVGVTTIGLLALTAFWAFVIE